MKQENKTCRSCGSFCTYYTMGYCSLMRENNGYCSRHDKVTDKSESCDKWHFRHSISRARRMKIAVKSLPEIYKKIAVIEQILREDAKLLKIYSETDNNEN